MTAPPLDPVSVAGGVGGIVADCAEIAAMGRTFGVAAEQILHTAWTLHDYLVDPALMLSAPFDPAGVRGVRG